MKGVVFTELLDLIENKYGYTMVDTLLTNCDLASKGIYTSVGNYPSEELHSLINELHNKISKPQSELLHELGVHLFSVFERMYKDYFVPYNHAFDFLKNINELLEIELHKLYPEEHLAIIEYNKVSETKLELTCPYTNKMCHLIIGLLEALTHYYCHSANIVATPVDLLNENLVRFTITIV